MARLAQASGILVEGSHLLLRANIGRKISQMHIVIAARSCSVSQIEAKIPGSCWLNALEAIMSRARLRFRLMLVMPVRVIPASAAGDLIGGQPEKEEVLFAGCRGHLDRGAVARADRERAIHHELHVARPTGLEAGGGDLFGDIARRNQSLRQADVVFRQKSRP